LTAGLVLAAMMTPPAAALAMPAARTRDFLDSIGVNAHIEYTDSRYANLAQVSAALKYIGVDHVRDSAPWHGNQGQAGYGLLAETGIKFEVFFNRTLPIQIDELSTLVTRHQGAVDLVEGPNEVNNFHVSYLGQTGTAGAQAYQAALYDAVKGRPELASIPALLFTDYPDHPGKADLGNLHSYPRRGAQPAATLAHDLGDELKVAPGLPVYCTEAGYTTLVEEPHGEGAPEPIVADLIANLLFDAFASGIKRTYIYELLDEFEDPQHKDMQKHFGLFHTDYSPKPSALFLHNLHSVLGRDTGAEAAPQDLAISVDGAKSILLQRSDGRYALILWREPKLWNPDLKSAAPASPEQVTVHFDKPRTASVYHPMIGTAASSTPKASSLALELAEDPVVLSF